MGTLRNNNLLFRFIRELGSDRFQTEGYKVAFVGRRRTEELIRSVKVIQDAKHPVALGEFLMMKIMGFRRDKSWKMVTRVHDDGVDRGGSEPQSHHCHMRGHNDRSLIKNSRMSFYLNISI